MANGPAFKDTDVLSDHEQEVETRLNVRLSPEVRKTLDWVAANRGVTAVEAIRRAIGTEKFFLELENQKAKIFVQVPGEKTLKEVLFR